MCGVASLSQYQGLHWLTETIPLFKSLNTTRLYFIEPLVLMVLFVISLKIVIRKLYFSYIAIVLLVGVQYIYAINQSNYKLTSQTNYLSFDEYYAPTSFQKIRQDIIKTSHKDISQVKVISYGMEPAVALYNGLYTIDGYSPNYPLSYKKSFRKILLPYLNAPALKNSKKMFDDWGSKLYILSINSEPTTYRYFIDGNVSSKVPLNANIDAMCDMGTDYIISSHELKNYDTTKVIPISNYQDKFWRVWLYEIKCSSR